MISPIVLVNVFTFFHWWNIENTLKKRIHTLPLFILQIWPQYRVARILYFGLYRDKNGTKWKEEKLIYDKNLSCLGKESKLKCKCMIFMLNLETVTYRCLERLWLKLGAGYDHN